MLPKGTKTYTGIAILALPPLARSLGIDFSEGDATLLMGQFQQALDAVITLTGAIIAIYGRWDATRTK